MDDFDLEERQTVAACLGFFGLCIAVPLIVLVGSAIGMGWASIFGVHDVHGTILGWLSDKGVNGQGQTTWGIGNVVWQYYLSVVTVYIAYQVCELIYGGFKAFRGALA